MSKNITILVFLGLMIGCAVYLGSQFKELHKQRVQLSIDTADLAKKRNDLDLQKRTFQAQDSISSKIINEIKTRDVSIHDTSFHRLISKYKTNEALIETNISDPEKNAASFERAGFQAIVDNRFDIALDQFTKAEKAFSSFHMCYEISKLLKSRQADFGNTQKEEDIKMIIYKKYSWKAPKDLLFKLGEQLAP